jgi:hypothetical protein
MHTHTRDNVQPYLVLTVNIIARIMERLELDWEALAEG